MRRLTGILATALLAAALSACGSDQPTTAATTASPKPLPASLTDYDVMRDKVVLGLAKDFRAGTHAGPTGYAICVRLGVRRALGVDQLNRLVAIYRRPDGQPLAAQALNRLAAPVGAECGGAKFVPELVTASAALAGRYPLSRLAIAARRLGITYGPYLGLTCREATSTRCDEVGIDLVLRREARAVSTRVGGRRMVLRTPGEHDGVAGKDWVGRLRRVGLERPGSPFRIPVNGRSAKTWAGNPPVNLPVRIAVVYPDGARVAGTVPRVLLSPGWG